MEERINLLEQRIDDHINDFNEHKELENTRWDKLILLQEQNTQYVKELTESTKDIIEAWHTADNIGRFVKWLSGFGAFGLFILWCIDKLK